MTDLTAEHPDQPHYGWARAGNHVFPVHARTIDHLPVNHKNWYIRWNAKIAVWVTIGVGSMTCAWIFAAIAIAGLPTSLKPNNIGLLFWISSDFLQLTLLSVIIVGQNIQAQAADARAAKTFEDTEQAKADLQQAKADLITTLDRLDCGTEGGLKTILDRIAALELRLPPATGS